MSGVPTTVTQTNSYALPPHANAILATVACELSADGTTFALTAGTTTGVVSAASFIRCTTSTTCAVVIRPA